MKQQIRLGHFLQGGVKTLDEMVGQATDEADRIGEQEEMTLIDIHAAGGGVEGGEEAVGHQDVGLGDRPHQRRLARVGISDQGRREMFLAAARLDPAIAGHFD